MDEKVLIKSERASLKKFIIIMIVCVGVILVSFVDYIVKSSESTALSQNEFDLRYYNAGNNYNEDLHNVAEKAYREANHAESEAGMRTVILGIPLLIVAIVSLIQFLSLKDIELVITDKRAYGKTSFGKRVDLPLDAISAVGISGKKNIAISTSSGKIAFNGIINRDEIHTVLNDLLIKRQNQSQTTEPRSTNKSDYTEELKKIKDLLDAGVITQEEFDAKKKQILGL